VKLKSIYIILEEIQKRPAMYLGNGCTIESLNNFVLGFIFGGGKSNHKSSSYPDFSLFTGWIGGIFKYKYENSSGNWSWFLTEKYPNKEKALNKFFHYLQVFKKEKIEVTVIPIKKEQVEYSIKNQLNYIYCGNNNSYDRNLRKLDRIILFKIGRSRTLFCIAIDKNDKILDQRNTDMTGNILLRKIEKQFNMKSVTFDKKNEQKGKQILETNKII
jgi:hypothetical protein